MKRLPKINKADYHLVPKDPDQGFDPERNGMVIENSIRKYEAMRAKKAREYGEQLGERSSAIATYIKSVDQGGANSNAEKYFSKQQLAHLRGQEILEKLRSGYAKKES